jgi:transcriptional regulator with XRE-family HTH domain
MSHLVKIGKAMKARRKALRLSQEDVVGLAEMDRGHYSEIENGKRNISVETLKRIADALHTPAWKLLKDAEK